MPRFSRTPLTGAARLTTAALSLAGCSSSGYSGEFTAAEQDNDYEDAES